MSNAELIKKVQDFETYCMETAQYQIAELLQNVLAALSPLSMAGSGDCPEKDEVVTANVYETEPAAFSPVLPDEVERIITDLDAARHILYNHGMKDAAKEFGVLISKIERLQLNLTNVEEYARSISEDHTRLQQRIDAYEKALERLGSSAYRGFLEEHREFARTELERIRND